LPKILITGSPSSGWAPKIKGDFEMTTNLLSPTFFQTGKSADTQPETVDSDWVLFQLQRNISASAAGLAMQKITAGFTVDAGGFLFSALGGGIEPNGETVTGQEIFDEASAARRERINKAVEATQDVDINDLLF